MEQTDSSASFAKVRQPILDIRAQGDSTAHPSGSLSASARSRSWHMFTASVHGVSRSQRASTRHTRHCRHVSSPQAPTRPASRTTLRVCQSTSRRLAKRLWQKYPDLKRGVSVRSAPLRRQNRRYVRPRCLLPGWRGSRSRFYFARPPNLLSRAAPPSSYSSDRVLAMISPSRFAVPLGESFLRR